MCLQKLFGFIFMKINFEIGYKIQKAIAYTE